MTVCPATALDAAAPIVQNGWLADPVPLSLQFGLPWSTYKVVTIGAVGAPRSNTTTAARTSILFQIADRRSLRVIIGSFVYADGARRLQGVTPTCVRDRYAGAVSRCGRLRRRNLSRRATPHAPRRWHRLRCVAVRIPASCGCAGTTLDS